MHPCKMKEKIGNVKNPDRSKTKSTSESRTKTKYVPLDMTRFRTENFVRYFNPYDAYNMCN